MNKSYLLPQHHTGIIIWILNMLYIKDVVMEKVRLAYMAAVLDGDGSFGLFRNPTKPNPTYYVLVQLANRSKKVIDCFLNEFGGTWRTKLPVKNGSGEYGRATYRWRVRSSCNVTPLLDKIIPFLRIKRERAECLRDFIEKFPFKPGYIQSKEVIESKERFYIKMKNYNDWTGFSNNVSTKLVRKNSKDPLFWAYVAGIMDTDGSFTIKKQVTNRGTCVKNPRYLPMILISFTDTRAINYMRENCYFGKLCVPRNKSCSNGFHYQFSITKKDQIVEFTENVIPFMLSKAPNAQAILDFCKSSKKTGYCKKGVPAQELAFREECHQKLKNLNKYGVVKSPLMDLKPLPGNAGGNKAQAGKPCSVNAVSEETTKVDAVL